MIDANVLRECAEAIMHGPADAYGRCPWCGVKFEAKRPRYIARDLQSDLVLAYRRMYDPDWNGGRADADI